MQIFNDLFSCSAPFISINIGCHIFEGLAFIYNIDFPFCPHILRLVYALRLGVFDNPAMYVHVKMVNGVIYRGFLVNCDAAHVEHTGIQKVVFRTSSWNSAQNYNGTPINYYSGQNGEIVRTQTEGNFTSVLCHVDLSVFH